VGADGRTGTAWVALGRPGIACCLI